MSEQINRDDLILLRTQLQNSVRMEERTLTKREGEESDLAIVSLQGNAYLAFKANNQWFYALGFSGENLAQYIFKKSITAPGVSVGKIDVSGAVTAGSLVSQGDADITGDNNVTGDAKISGDLALKSPTTLTISSGEIKITKSYHLVAVEVGTTDDLDTISGGQVGGLLVLQASTAAKTVVCKDGTGNLKLAGDFSLDNTQDSIYLIYDGSNWIELSRSNNA